MLGQVDRGGVGVVFHSRTREPLQPRRPLPVGAQGANQAGQPHTDPALAQHDVNANETYGVL